MSDSEEGVISINTVYRITWTDPPSLRDFQSNAEKGIELNSTSTEAARLHDGISVFRTLSQARKTARRRAPWRGRGFIAQIDIPSNSAVRIERTLKSAGHYTLWADAESMLSWVASVEPVILPEK
jgi:hypothetical protein